MTKVNYGTIPRLLSSRSPFKGHSMSAERIESGTRVYYSGQRLFGDDQLQADAPTYVVFSYRTPIAWITSNGTVVVPDIKYSQTTTRHQNLCRGNL